MKGIVKIIIRVMAFHSVFLFPVSVIGQGSPMLELSALLKRGTPYTQDIHSLFASKKRYQKAHKLYQTVLNNDSSFAYFYKFRDRRARQNLFHERFTQVTRMDLEPRVLLKSSYDIDRLIGEELSKLSYLEKRKQILSNDPEDKAKSSLANYHRTIRNRMRLLGTNHYFGISNAEGLEKNGTIYHPRTRHNWMVNLSWLFAHLQKKNSFIIVSPLQGNLMRHTKGQQDHYSAFAREIAVCLKAGYVVTKQGEKIQMTPPNSFNPSNCQATRDKGFGVNPTDQEVERWYRTLEQAVTQGVDFRYSVQGGLSSLN